MAVLAHFRIDARFAFVNITVAIIVFTVTDLFSGRRSVAILQHTSDTLAASFSAIDLAEFVRVFIGLTVHVVVDAVADFFFTRVNRRTTVFEHPVDA